MHGAGHLPLAEHIPGPQVGEVKRALLMHCACKPRDNDPKMLERIAKDIGKGNKA